MALIGDTLYVANTDALVSVPYEVGQTSIQAMPRVVAPLPGRHVDTRVKPERPDLVAKAVVPDYALGPHTASLGLAFSMNSSLPAPYAAGAFIGQHGSWNRRPRSGY